MLFFIAYSVDDCSMEAITFILKQVIVNAVFVYAVYFVKYGNIVNICFLSVCCCSLC